jgi:hypothetical protein
VLLTAFLQLPHALRKRFGIPPAPAPSYYRPGVPYEAFRYTEQTPGVEQAPDASDAPDAAPARTGKKETPQRMIRVGKIALAILNRPDHSSGSAAEHASTPHVSPIATRNR